MIRSAAPPLISRDPIDLARLVAAVEAPEAGGIATFTGLVRNHHQGRGVSRLEYSAYESMAEQEMRTILSEAESRWAVKVVATHRLGTLEVGDVAVAVAAAGAHRAEAFEACRHVIEELKRRVPVWKREQYADGSEAWVEPREAQ